MAFDPGRPGEIEVQAIEWDGYRLVRLVFFDVGSNEPKGEVMLRRDQALLVAQHIGTAVSIGDPQCPL